MLAPKITEDARPEFSDGQSFDLIPEICEPRWRQHSCPIAPKMLQTQADYQSQQIRIVHLPFLAGGQWTASRVFWSLPNRPELCFLRKRHLDVGVKQGKLEARR